MIELSFSGEAFVERRDVGLGDGVVEHRTEAHVADVGDAAEVERIDAEDMMRGAHQRGEVAHRARAVARADPIGGAAVEGHAGDTDVETGEVELMRRAQEGRDLGKARREAWIVFGIVADAIVEIFVAGHSSVSRLRAYMTIG